MKRDSTTLSISKIYIFLGIVAVTGIFLLFCYPQRSELPQAAPRNSDFINQVLQQARPVLASAWRNPTQYVGKKECALAPEVGEAFLECHPQGWRCLWQQQKHLTFEHAGSVFTLQSSGELTFIRRKVQGIKGVSGYVGHIEIPELNLRQKIFLSSTCHEMYLPARSYPYGEVADLRDPGFIWDNAGREIFIDKFYVSQGDVHEWKQFIGEEYSTDTPWKPAKLKEVDQKRFCAFHGKKQLMAHLFDASQMTPLDLRVHFPDMIVRPDTPWQRDHRRTFLAKEGRVSSQSCSLAQVKGCRENYFMTDSVSWSGIAFGLGFEEELFANPIDPELNLKKSSKHEEVNSSWHKLGRRTSSLDNKEYAFRCFRELL